MSIAIATSTSKWFISRFWRPQTRVLSSDVVKLFEDVLLTPEQIKKSNHPRFEEDLTYRKLIGKKKKKAKRNVVPVQYLTSITSTAFSSFPYLNRDLESILNRQYEKALDVQQLVLPKILANRSAIIQSETGSGKTLAFVIPIVNKLLNGSLSSKDRCIVIAPTKELCSQIHRVFLSLVPQSSSVLLLGSDSKNADIKSKRIINGVPIIISPPAALNHKFKQGILRLVDTSVLVIDEFDRLFAADFEDQINHLVSGLAKNRRNPQFLITSATMPSDLVSFVQTYVPAIEVFQNKKVNPPSIKHNWVICPLHRRTETLLQLLKTNRDKKIMIFVQKKNIGVGVHKVLQENGFNVQFLNGDMSRNQRDSIISGFKASQFNILVATDIVARGIDVPDCEAVIQIQPDNDVDMYLHRAGRTGRAGREGACFVLVCHSDPRDREMLRSVKGTGVAVEVTNAETILPEEESGVTSVLENSLHHVTTKKELSFSVDIVMTERLVFYQKLISDLNLTPVSVAPVPKKKILGLWYSSPVEAWKTQGLIKHHFKQQCLPEPAMGVFRHQSTKESVLDWDGYFSEIRRVGREEGARRYKEFVKRDMAAKRRRQGRFKMKHK